MPAYLQKTKRRASIGEERFTASGAIGVKNTSVHLGGEATMLKFKGALNFRYGNNEYRVKGSLYIGGVAFSGPLGLKSELKVAGGVGAGIGFEITKKE